MRLKHMSRRTEISYLHYMGAGEIRVDLSHLATAKNVAAST